jgi:acyl-coenzyme A thioesterase PaaI-like protein
VTGAEPLPREYPPPEHVLRDLRLWVDPAEGARRAGLPFAPELLGATGAVSSGVLSVLVDAIAGGEAIAAVRPDWIATSDMTLTWLRAVRGGDLVATPRVLRAGRSSVAIEVGVDCAGEPVALGTVSFARLEARGAFQQGGAVTGGGGARTVFGDEGRRLAHPLREELRVVTRDAAAGVIELPVTPYVGNSLGGLQGGVAVSALDFAAETLGAHALGRPVASSDLVVHFLALGRTGPMRTRGRVLRRDAGRAVLRVELLDAGEGERLCTIATVGVTADF